MVVDEHRFYPLAASYFKIEHSGGELLLGLVDENRETLFFEVYPTTGSGVVEPALLQWQPDGAATVSLGDQPAGDYWLVGSYPAVADSSEVRGFCFGGPEAMAACVPTSDEADTADPMADTAAPGDDGVFDERGPSGGSSDKGGCAALAGGAGASGLAIVLAMAMVGTRRHA